MLKEDSQNFQCFLFASVFNANDRPSIAWSSELEVHDCGNSDFPFVDTEIATERHLKDNAVIRHSQNGFTR